MGTRKLLSLTGWCKDITLSVSETKIGRASSCEAKIAFGHISSTHCRVLLQDNKTLVQDLSSNGTFINQKKIGKNDAQELQNGDTLTLTPPGERSVEAVAFVFQDSEASQTRKSVFDKEKLRGFQLTILKKLGKGSYGEVFMGVTPEGVLRAVKIVNKTKNAQADAKLWEEVKVMDCLRHPHIVGIYDVHNGSDHLIMTLDLASGGDLEKLLKTLGRLSESDSKSLLVQILNALEYLHQSHVIHRDLKPENILIKDPLNSKSVPHLLLTDFGLSRLVDKHNTRTSTVCGTPLYAAPEIVRADMNRLHRRKVVPYDEKVDLWSTGVLLYRLVNGVLPWKSATRVTLADQILSAADPAKSVQMEHSVSHDCQHFIKSLIVDPEHRLSATAALQHKWFEESRRKLTEDQHSDNEATQLFHEDKPDTVPDQFVKESPSPADDSAPRDSSYTTTPGLSHSTQRKRMKSSSSSSH